VRSADVAALQFSTGGPTVLPIARAAVFFDGTFSQPRIFSPEGVAISPEGWIWCGTGEGRILRIAPDASRLEQVAHTNGFILGLAFDGAGHLFACDLRHACVFRVTLATGELTRFTPPGIRIPNYPVVDGARGVLYVSDSHGFNDPGPGVWRYDLTRVKARSGGARP
jgi:sugar lactone lactonase YvrE